MPACPSTSRPPPRPAPPPRPEAKTRIRHGRISPGSPATGRTRSDDRRPRRLAPAASRQRRGGQESGQPSHPCHRQRTGGPAHRYHARPGRAALPQVETRLAQVEAWWQQHRSGQSVPEAPDAEFLARVFISALDIANDAHYAQEDWESALRRTDTILEVKRALERPEEDIAGTRMNRANVLGRLGRFGEAKAELEVCLQVFQNDPPGVPRCSVPSPTCSTNKATWPRPSPSSAAPSPSREQLPDPADRAISHNNLANYLERSGTPVRPRRIPPPPTRRPHLPPRRRAGAGTPDLAAQLRHPFPPRPRCRHAARPCPAWPNCSPTPPSTRWTTGSASARPSGRGAGRRGPIPGQARQAALEQE